MSYAQKIHLDYSTYKSINCGLRWDPADEGLAIADLDLVYAAYDEYGELIEVTSGKQGDRFAAMGSIYHSGDDDDGADDADDERVAIELLTVPRNIHYIFLLVEIHSRHVFRNVENPHIRIAQGVTDVDIVTVPLGGEEGDDCKSYVFVRLDRKAGGWDLNVLNRYPLLEEHVLANWQETLQEYLPTINIDPSIARPDTPNKGETAPLFYTKEARHRIVCGIGWDPATTEQKNGTPFDLDLTCVMFDQDGEYYDFVTSLPEHNIDESGAVYHTGDAEDGQGAGDDEQVSVELIKLPEAVKHVFFIVDSKSAHSLGEINNPHIRLADGKTNKDQLHTSLSDGATDNACIFAHLIREHDKWILHYIHEYLNSTDIEDWTQPLEKYLASS